MALEIISGMSMIRPCNMRFPPGRPGSAGREVLARTSASRKCPAAISPDDLIRPREQRLRDRQPEHLCGLEVLTFHIAQFAQAFPEGLEQDGQVAGLPPASEGEAGDRKPIRATFPCWAWAVSGAARRPPAINAMKVRRFIVPLFD